MYSKFIDLDKLASKLSQSSQNRLCEADALSALQSFFYRAQNISSGEVPNTIWINLNNIAKKYSDMSKIRRHFTTMCYLAYKAQSITIPPVLLQFFLACPSYVLKNDSRHLGHWEHAIKYLKNLASSIEINQALNYLSRGRNRTPRRSYNPNYGYNSYSEDSEPDTYDPYDPFRGRNFNRAFGRRRARTTPPVYYPPVARIAAPNFLALPPSRGIMNGFPSPSLFTVESYRDAEMEDIRAQQWELAGQVQQLAIGQQVLEDEVVQGQVQVPGFFGPQLAIGY